MAIAPRHAFDKTQDVIFSVFVGDVYIFTEWKNSTYTEKIYMQLNDKTRFLTVKYLKLF